MARLMRPKDVVRDLSKVAKKHGYRVSFTYQMGDTSTTEAGTETTKKKII